MQSRPVVTPGLKGIDQRWPAPATSAVAVRDMRWDGRGFWTSAGGYGLIAEFESNEVLVNPLSGIGTITSMHYFSQHNGARNWLIYEAENGNLYQFNPSTAFRNGSPGDIAEDRAGNQQTDRAAPTTPWQHSQSATWGDNFYIVNGINRPLVFDGYSWDYAGFSGPPGAPSATVLNNPKATTTAGAKLVSLGLGPVSDDTAVDYKVGYRYRVSMINSRGQESPLSAPSPIVTFTNTGGTTVDDGAHFIMVGLPIGAAECVGRRIYRTQNIYDSTGTAIQAYGEIFFPLMDVPDNVTTQVLDARFDASLPGVQVDPLALGPFPTGAKYIASFKGCMFVAASTQTDVYFSAPGMPEVFPIDNVMPVGDSYLGPITGLYGTRNALVVFKESGIYFIKGDPVSGFTASLFTKTTGCVAPNTIREVPGLGLMFLGSGGVYLLRGTLENEGVQTEIVPMHIPVTEWIKKINRSAAIGAFAAVYHRDKEYWLAVPVIGKDQNNLVLVYHYEIGEWSYRENYPISCMLETSDHRGHLLFGSWDLNTEGIYVYSPGFDDKAGTAIEPLYQSGWSNAGAIYRSMRPKYVQVQCGLHGDNPLNLSVYTNRSLTEWPEQPGQAQQYPEDVQPVYGTATFDSGTDWQQFRPGTLRFDISNFTAAIVHEVSVAFEPDAGKRWMSLVTLDPEMSPDDPNEWKPMGRTQGAR